MATRRQPLSFGWLIPGAAAACLLVIVALAAFLALWLEAPQAPWQTILSDSYLWHVVRFSFWQAFCRRYFRWCRRYSLPAPCIAAAFRGARCCCACAR